LSSYNNSTMSWKDAFIQKKFSQYQELLVKKSACLSAMDESMYFLAIVREDKPQSRKYGQSLLVRATSHNDALIYLMRYYDVDELKEISASEYQHMQNHPMYHQADTNSYENVLYDLKSLERELTQFDEFKIHFNNL
jgi:hypothetical protein